MDFFWNSFARLSPSLQFILVTNQRLLQFKKQSVSCDQRFNLLREFFFPILYQSNCGTETRMGMLFIIHGTCTAQTILTILKYVNYFIVSSPKHKGLQVRRKYKEQKFVKFCTLALTIQMHFQMQKQAVVTLFSLFRQLSAPDLQ